MSMCFDCKYQCIRETSYEWIDNFCKHPNKLKEKNDPYDGCELHEAITEENETR